MAYTTINKSTDHFNTVLYTGNTSGQSITGVGFQPDWLWVKSRSAAYQNSLRDSIRGSTKTLRSNGNNAEQTQSDSVTSFDSDGFTLGADSNSFVNENGATYASWNWKASGSTASNSDGSITSTVSVNTTAGFSIVKYTGNGNSTATIGHGLSVAPSMIISKNLSTATNADWCVYHKGLTTDKNLFLNLTSAEVTPSYGTINAPTNSLINVTKGSGNQTNSAHDFIMYCFAEKTGYSKFGTYEGNNNSDGTFVYTGFKPAWLLVKAASGSQTPGNQSWPMWDNKRSSTGGFNENSYKLYANASDAEATSAIAQVDLVSNGFKFRNSTHQSNSSNTYIYMAFGQSLVGSNNVPCTAR